MSRVSISRCESYRTETVVEALQQALAPLGGMGAFVSPGQRVLLKVNLLSRAEPDRAVTTHPELVRALIRSVKAAGGVPLVGDSPGGPSSPGYVAGVYRATGMTRVCEEEGAELLDFASECVRVPNPAGSLYGSFTLARPVVDCDVLISVPKLKTHGFMMFTGAVKNLFGCIPGLEKATYHLRVPDRDDFGAMLVDLMLACKPALAVMDAVVGMEGEGPAGGTPRPIGALLASEDCLALDVVASAMAGLGADEVYTTRSAVKRGLVAASVDEIDVLGVPWSEFLQPGFALPVRDISSKMPSWLAPRMRSWVTPKPFLDQASGCTRCKTCERSCPVSAIEMRDTGPTFDYGTCIRCYCCQELCPEQVIGLKVPPLARVFTRRTTP